MFLSVVCAFGLVHLLEFGWINRPPMFAIQWPKGRAMRFIWAGVGILTVLGQIPLGIMTAVAGLPVCLAHLRLVDRTPAARIGVADVANDLYRVGRASIRRLFDQTRIGPH
jgi:hypothetical protein